MSRATCRQSQEARRCRQVSKSFLWLLLGKQYQYILYLQVHMNQVIYTKKKKWKGDVRIFGRFEAWSMIVFMFFIYLEIFRYISCKDIFNIYIISKQTQPSISCETCEGTCSAYIYRIYTYTKNIYSIYTIFLRFVIVFGIYMSFFFQETQMPKQNETLLLLYNLQSLIKSMVLNIFLTIFIVNNVGWLLY